MSDYEDRTPVELKLTLDRGAVAAIGVGASNPEPNNPSWVDALHRGTEALREACENHNLDTTNLVEASGLDGRQS